MKLQQNQPKALIGISVAIGVFALTQGQASAQAVVYTNRASFLNAVGGGTTNIDFSAAVSSGTRADYDTSAGLTLSGVQFVGVVNAGGYNLSVLTPGYNSAYSGWNGNPTVLDAPSGDGPNGGSPAGYLQINLPANVYSVGTNLYTVAVGDDFRGTNTVAPITVILSTGGSYQITTFSKPNLAFAGFTSSVPITSMTFATPSNSPAQPFLSSFVFKQGTSGASAPEPCSAALVLPLLAFASMSAARRRRRVS